MAKEHRGKKPREDLDEQVTMRIAKVIAEAWKSDDFKRRFVAEPVKVLKAAGVPVPADVTIKVVEDEKHLRHIVVPLKPPGLGDEEGERQGVDWCSHLWCSGHR